MIHGAAIRNPINTFKLPSFVSIKVPVLMSFFSVRYLDRHKQNRISIYMQILRKKKENKKFKSTFYIKQIRFTDPPDLRSVYLKSTVCTFVQKQTKKQQQNPTITHCDFRKSSQKKRPLLPQCFLHNKNRFTDSTLTPVIPPLAPQL